MYRTTALRELTTQEIDALVDLYQNVCPMPQGYYRTRLQSGPYDAVAYATDTDGRIVSAQLLNDFVVDDRRYVYLGPLVSTRHAYFGLIAHLIYRLHAATGERALTIMAEVQNPIIAVTLSYAFGDACSPRLGSSLTPSDKDLVTAFVERLDHIDAVDIDTCTTKSTTSMFRARLIHAPIVAWFKARGVDFAAGHSQIVLIGLVAGEARRAKQLQLIADRSSPLLGKGAATAARDVLTWFFRQSRQTTAPSNKGETTHDSREDHVPREARGRWGRRSVALFGATGRAAPALSDARR